jgi:hypothetical protein
VCTTCLSVSGSTLYQRETLKHVVHKVLRYIVEHETLRQVVHKVFRYSVEHETLRHVVRVLVSHVPQYILKLVYYVS